MENIYEYCIEAGTRHIEFVYSNFVIENECCQSVRTDEERAFVYMKTAKQYEELDNKIYTKYLKMTLNA